MCLCVRVLFRLLKCNDMFRAPAKPAQSSRQLERFVPASDACTSRTLSLLANAFTIMEWFSHRWHTHRGIVSRCQLD